MAFIDYGAIAFKNKKLISTDVFTPMKDTCGFSDKDNREGNFDGNYFVVCGDNDLCVGFYKTLITWKTNYEDTAKSETFDWYQEFKKWKYWVKDILYESKELNGGYEEVYITVKPRNGYCVAKWNYKGDKYKVYFGYGVDLNFYKKTKRVNYYRSPEYYLKELKYKIKR